MLSAFAILGARLERLRFGFPELELTVQGFSVGSAIFRNDSSVSPCCFCAIFCVFLVC